MKGSGATIMLRELHEMQEQNLLCLLLLGCRGVTGFLGVAEPHFEIRMALKQ